MNDFYKHNRERVLAQMPEGVMIIPASLHATYSYDVHYKYRHNSDLFYLTGFTEPEAVLVLAPGHEHPYTLFVLPRDLEKEIWNGFRHGVDGAKAHFGADAAYPIDELAARLPAYLENVHHLYYTLGEHEAFDRIVLDSLQQVRRKVRTGVFAPESTTSVGHLLHEMRLFKQPHEIERMQKAADITAAAHIKAMEFVRPGGHEYEVEALIEYEFKRHGAVGPAYPSIVGSGLNATILHYIENRAPLKNGEILLIDAGCEYQGYNADLTRSIPVNGTFTPAQRQIYDLVLEAQKRAIAAVQPGHTFMQIHETALGVLVEGLKELKLLGGSTEEILEKETYKKFFMHKTSHWLGLDVHDRGEYKLKGEWRPLAPGMVLTVEPGLYFGPHLAGEIPAEFLHVGIRIEDDVQVTATGHHVLTAACPKEVADVEGLMGK